MSRHERRRGARPDDCGTRARTSRRNGQTVRRPIRRHCSRRHDAVSRTPAPTLTKVERDYAREMISAYRTVANRREAKLGTRFAWLADEWYHIAEIPYPPKSHYEEFPQLEDGIGTVRLFLENAKQVSKSLPMRVRVPINATLITGGDARRHCAGFCPQIEPDTGRERQCLRDQKSLFRRRYPHCGTDDRAGYSGPAQANFPTVTKRSICRKFACATANFSLTT